MKKTKIKRIKRFDVLLVHRHFDSVNHDITYHNFTIDEVVEEFYTTGFFPEGIKEELNDLKVGEEYLIGKDGDYCYYAIRVK